MAEGRDAQWTPEILDEFLWECGILPPPGFPGLRQAASLAFKGQGYKLVSVSQEPNTHPHIYFFRLRMIGELPRRSHREMRALVRWAFRSIGCKIKAADFEVGSDGRRLLVSATMPRWVRA